MIEYYNLNTKKQQSKNKILESEALTIYEDSDLKNAILQNKIGKIKILNMKNSNINDNTVSLLWNIKSSERLCLEEINLSENFSFITDLAVDYICQSTSMIPCLKRLYLADNAITDQSIDRLGKCEAIHLEELTLYGNSDITSQSLYYLAKSFYFKNLKVLDLHATSIDDEGLVFYLKSTNSASLQILNISMNWQRVNDLTLDALATSQHCKNIRELYLEDCMVTDGGIGELADSSNIEHLEVLVLNNSINLEQQNIKRNLITDDSLKYIAYGRKIANLKILELRNTEITATGIRMLAASLSSQKIQKLRLSHCTKIASEVITYLQTMFSYLSMKKYIQIVQELAMKNAKFYKRNFPTLTQYIDHFISRIFITDLYRNINRRIQEMAKIMNLAIKESKEIDYNYHSESFLYKSQIEIVHELINVIANGIPKRMGSHGSQRNKNSTLSTIINLNLQISQAQKLKEVLKAHIVFLTQKSENLKVFQKKCHEKNRIIYGQNIKIQKYSEILRDCTKKIQKHKNQENIITRKCSYEMNRILRNKVLFEISNKFSQNHINTLSPFTKQFNNPQTIKFVTEQEEKQPISSPITKSSLRKSKNSFSKGILKQIKKQLTQRQLVSLEIKKLQQKKQKILQELNQHNKQHQQRLIQVTDQIDRKKHRYCQIEAQQMKK